MWFGFWRFRKARVLCVCCFWLPTFSFKHTRHMPIPLRLFPAQRFSEKGKTMLTSLGRLSFCWNFCPMQLPAFQPFRYSYKITTQTESKNNVVVDPNLTEGLKDKACKCEGYAQLGVISASGQSLRDAAQERCADAKTALMHPSGSARYSW
jgi:hypothetical protein